ncbi:copper chaperone CopZ [Sporosarcina trichiuri]|uniref:copper chaperone CopZ n=1 Tax=Sporosarcina trichiuri TaxID=3056445 RepID=UPI0025B59480|nr:copper chaperone CopZ [Sporosarcina sp. 0.2-SM1T-5]WJY28052.1 copper chaperone CopZ [Sporosarcina sp. 0.2-SM1T-5]
MKEVLKVEGMSCQHCVNAVETNVGEISGVSSVKVDLPAKEVAVEYDNEATMKQVKETIEDQGYDVV